MDFEDLLKSFLQDHPTSKYKCFMKSAKPTSHIEDDIRKTYSRLNDMQYQEVSCSQPYITDFVKYILRRRHTDKDSSMENYDFYHQRVGGFVKYEPENGKNWRVDYLYNDSALRIRKFSWKNTRQNGTCSIILIQFPE